MNPVVALKNSQVASSASTQSYIGVLSSPDSYLASCIPPGVPDCSTQDRSASAFKGGRRRVRTNQSDQSIMSSKTSSMSHLSESKEPYFCSGAERRRCEVN